MKSFVINLSRDTEKLEQFKHNAQYLDDCTVVAAVDGRDVDYKKLTGWNFDTNKDWRDPLLERTLTKGEIGCFLSHWTLWQRCAAGDEPFLIFEDDVVLTDKLPNTIDEHLTQADILFLLWNEMRPQGSVDCGTYKKLCYPYWTCAYIITPDAARTLINSGADKSIIPADEFLSFMGDKLRLHGLVDAPCELRARGSSTEPSHHGDYFIDFNTHVLTVASDESKAAKLFESAKNYGIKVKNIWPKNKRWDGGLTNFTTGGGVKFNLLRKALDKLPEHDVVLMTDAYDVFFGAELDEIVNRFLSFKTEVVVQAESVNWPDDTLLWPPSVTPYRYICSGCLMGRVKELKKILDVKLANDESDQLFLQKQFLSGHYSIKLDYEHYLFAAHDLQTTVRNSSIFNPRTKCFSTVYHGNGGPEAKSHFERLYRQMFPLKDYAMTRVFDVIGPEMLLIDYKTPEQCQRWIDISEEHGGWNPHPADKFPSHDIHLRELGLWEEAEEHWKNVVAPIIDNYWNPMHHEHLRKAFTMKYSADTQKTLGLHNDSSQVTGSVKLNDDYEGATLHWPRQKINNSDIPVGKMIIFPGMVTHGHYVDELTSGTKYSATFWTARYKGEYLD